jgi:Arc/MetJ family transcription regulator
MARTLIDIDDELLAQAAEILGTPTKKDTVNGALAEVVAMRAREEELQFWRDGGLPDLADPDVMEQAWR